MMCGQQRVEAHHLRRRAYLYVRQAVTRRVFDNGQNTERQYALGHRAVALGWKPDQIVVIDSDQGRSAGPAGEREGFERLVADVGRGRVGIVMSVEVSRLARTRTDWHRLLDVCASSHTLILDEDGVHNATDCDDRLLLPRRGTIREAELHVVQMRREGMQRSEMCSLLAPPAANRTPGAGTITARRGRTNEGQARPDTSGDVAKMQPATSLAHVGEDRR